MRSFTPRVSSVLPWLVFAVAYAGIWLIVLAPQRAHVVVSPGGYAAPAAMQAGPSPLQGR